MCARVWRPSRVYRASRLSSLYFKHQGRKSTQSSFRIRIDTPGPKVPRSRFTAFECKTVLSLIPPTKKTREFSTLLYYNLHITHLDKLPTPRTACSPIFHLWLLAGPRVQNSYMTIHYFKTIRAVFYLQRTDKVQAVKGCDTSTFDISL